MNGKDTDLEEKVGYYGEELILKMTQLGLGTCWVGATYDDSKFTIPEKEKLVCIILIGKIQKSLKDNVIRRVASSKNKKDSKERIVTKEEIPQWIMEGLEAIRMAPSAMNTQKPMLYYKDSDMTMRVPKDAKWDMVDLGIAKKHFELGTKRGKFELGNDGKFIIFNVDEAEN